MGRSLTTLAALLTLTMSCASLPPNQAGNPAAKPSLNPVGTGYRTAEALSAPPSDDEKNVVASARTLMGKPPGSTVVVNGRTFTLDCTGTVAAIFYRLSIDVTKDFNLYRGNGVKRLHAGLLARNALHRDILPRPGDIVFWDNTWDANDDGDKNNDPLTHAGVVIAVDPDGTIHYVHSHIRRGVVVEVMNLRRPKDYYDGKGKVINHALALGSGISRTMNPEHWLSGDLWNCFADILRVKKHFLVLGYIGEERPVLLSLRE